MNHLRLRTKLGLIVGILVLCVLAVALVGYRQLGGVNQRVQHMVDVTSKKVFLDGHHPCGPATGPAVRVPRRPDPGRQGIPRARRAAREIAKQVDATYLELDKLIEASDDRPERQALQKFRQAWQEYDKPGADAEAGGGELERQVPRPGDGQVGRESGCHQPGGRGRHCGRSRSCVPRPRRPTTRNAWGPWKRTARRSPDSR